MGVFSFCLYGTEPNYYTGLLENIALIKEYYPTFSIIVYKGPCDPTWVLPEEVKVFETGVGGVINMLYRWIPLRTRDVGFVRDADSRIDARDRWCIDEFLKSTKDYHVIRDHMWHTSRIMGGTFGWKKCIPDLEISLDREIAYGGDELVLVEKVYPLIKPDILVHTCLVAFHLEHVQWIERPRDSDTDFVGNVIWNGVPKYQYTANLEEAINRLQANDQFAILKRLTDQIDPRSIAFGARSITYDSIYRANLHCGDRAKAQFWMGAFEFADIIPHNIFNSNFLLPMLGKVVASFDPAREPADDEVVIVYGTYPDWHKALPATRKMYRHVSLFNQVNHAVVESHPCWDSVDIIYILNLEERVDRYYETLCSLAKVAAPLHKVHHYRAKKDGLPPYAGATKNHTDVMEHFNASGHNTCLILEDDIVFTDDTSRVHNSITEFFKRAYEYSICFLAVSRIGNREPFDDLLSMSKQECTTSSAYFLHKPTSSDVYRIAKEGLDIMIASGGAAAYGCIDRYWCPKIPLHFFKDKLAFQRPSYSNLMRTVIAHLD
jgi:hypothetical protein